MLPDPIISDAEVSIRIERGELVKLPAFKEPPADVQALAELRHRVATYQPPRRRQRAR
jgi:hypothetical protein